MWQESQTGQVTVFRQGCFNSVPSLRVTPTCTSTCVDNVTTAEDVKDSQLLFCCCNTNNCNQHFEWKMNQGSEGRLSAVEM